ncbi:MAG: LptA/OstA family protein [Rhodothalassiaceae bacterium]
MIPLRIPFVLLLAAGLCAIDVRPLAAQAISALRAHDVDQPIEWEADRSELLGREDTALFIGHVKVTQGTLVLRADRLYVFYKLLPDSRDPEVERLDATGHVVIESPSESVTADWGVYDIVNRIITLGGVVTLRRGETELTGKRLEIDLRNGVTKLDANGVGGEAGRVRGRFAVPKKESGTTPDEKEGGGK